MRSMIIMHRPICRRTDVRGRYPDRRQSVMDNTTAKVSCFARAYHYKNNKMAAPAGVSYIYAVKEK